MKKILLVILGLLLMASIANAAGQEQANPFIQWFRTTTGTVITANWVSMTQTAAVIKAAPSTGHYRHSLVIRNLDTTNTVYIGASGVTAITGFPLKPGESITLDRNFASVYGICGSGLTATVAYLEEGF